MAKKKSREKIKAKLVEATISSLLQDGDKGCSIRKISAIAGVSTGLINYYYPSIQNLIADAYKEFAITHVERAFADTRSEITDPHEKIINIIAKGFDEISLDKNTMKAWVVFWRLTLTSEVVSEAHDITNNAYLALLEDIFEDLHRITPLNISPRMASIGLTAMMDGLWLEWILQSETFSLVEARSLCQRWVKSLIKE